MVKEHYKYENETMYGLDVFLDALKVKLMEQQKVKGDSWNTCPIEFLEEGRKREIGEVDNAEGYMRKAKELVDEAAYCMMLYNRYFNLFCEKAGRDIFRR